MKRGKGTKHHTKPGATPEAAHSSWEFLREVQQLVATCVSSGLPATGEYGVPTPAGKVKLTVRAEILVHATAPLIVRPS